MRKQAGRGPTEAPDSSKPDKLRPRAIDDKDSRAARAAAYAARMGTRQQQTEPDPTPVWLRTLLDACAKPAKRNPALAAALEGVPAKYRPTPTPKERP